MRVPLANVSTPDVMWVKARVELEVGGPVTVYDVSSGAVLAIFLGPTVATRDGWQAGPVSIVASLDECLCGGTVAVPVVPVARWRRRVPSRHVTRRPEL